MSVPTPTPTLLLKQGTAGKIGTRGAGLIHYRVTADETRSVLFVSVTGNDAGGYFSREDVPFATVIATLAQLDPEEPFSSAVFKSAFVGRSQNNAGFLAAILRAEQLLKPAPDRAHQHLADGDPVAWLKQCLKLPGEPLPLPAPVSEEVSMPATEEEPPEEAKPTRKPRGKRKEAEVPDES